MPKAYLMAGCGALLLGLAACERGGAPASGANQQANAAGAPAAEANSGGERSSEEARPPQHGGTAGSEVDQGHGSELPEGSANLDFIVVNRTGQTITAVSISPAGEESWSDDILAQRELVENERGAVSYTRDVEQCLWDLRATFEGGRNQSWPRRNLCNTIRVELR
jgi:hypothetical protein